MSPAAASRRQRRALLSAGNPRGFSNNPLPEAVVAVIDRLVDLTA
jgi:hypothetical protein